MTSLTGDIRHKLSLYDVVYVKVIEAKANASKSAAKGQSAADVTADAAAQLRVRPTVQGAALVLENRTGRILAMAGSFSYPLSQLNRTWQTERQPGSTIKPVTYLTALQKGLQPNTLIRDEPLTLLISEHRQDTNHHSRNPAAQTRLTHDREGQPGAGAKGGGAPASSIMEEASENP